MREFQEKKKRRKIIYSWWSFVLLGSVFVFFMFSSVKVYVSGKGAYVKNEDFQKSLNEAMKRKNELEVEIARMKSESGKEEEIRKKFNVAKPGERLLVIMDKNDKDDNIKIVATTTGFWKIFSKLFGKD